MHEIKGSRSIHGVEMKGETLTVHFNSGKAYTYDGVPETMMREMIDADSVGNYFATNIRPNFTGTLLTEDEDNGNYEKTTG